MSDVVEKVAHAWASMDGKPYGEGYVEDAAFLLRRSGVGRRIEELEEMLTSATMDGYDMAKNEYRSHIEELEAKVAKARVEGFWAGRSCGGSKKAIDTALAKLLKGQDNE